MIEYKTKYHMGAVLKEINELGDKKFRGKTGGELGNVMTLKKAVFFGVLCVVLGAYEGE